MVRLVKKQKSLLHWELLFQRAATVALHFMRVLLCATREEVCEALSMATFMGGGPSYAYSAKALDAYDFFTAQAK